MLYSLMIRSYCEWTGSEVEARPSLDLHRARASDIDHQHLGTPWQRFVRPRQVGLPRPPEVEKYLSSSLMAARRHDQRTDAPDHRNFSHHFDDPLPHTNAVTPMSPKHQEPTSNYSDWAFLPLVTRLTLRTQGKYVTPPTCGLATPPSRRGARRMSTTA